MEPGQLSHYERVGCGAWPPEDTVPLLWWLRDLVTEDCFHELNTILAGS